MFQNGVGDRRGENSNISDQRKPEDVTAIEFVFFDLGNVLVHFDPHRGCRNVSQWAGVSPQEVYAAVWESGLEERFEQGMVTPCEFAAAVVAHLDIPRARIDEAHQPLLDHLSDMFTPDPHILPVIDELQALRLRLGILSNTCFAHWDFIRRQQWPGTLGWSEIDVLSYEVGVMKPASSIYSHAAEQAGADPAAIFFTDDREENVEAALQAGWRAFPYRDPQKLRQDLRRCGVAIEMLARPSV